MFKGKAGFLFSAFTGMIVLIIFLFVTLGESQQGAYALMRITGMNISIQYFVGFILFLSLIPLLGGFKKSLTIFIVLFATLVLVRMTFVVMSLSELNVISDWTLNNMYASLTTADFMGSKGIIFMGFRLAFWSLVAVELFNLWKKAGLRRPNKVKMLLILALLSIPTMLPGIFIAGLYPYELWQLIVFSDEGCNGICASIALGQHTLGESGFILMTFSSILSSIIQVGICLLMMSKMIQFLGQQKLYFGMIQNFVKKYEFNERETFALSSTVAFVIALFITSLNFGSSVWVGLSLYMAFGLVLIVQAICVLNFKFKWFDSQYLNNRSLCVLTILSILLMGIMFYSGFRGVHWSYLNYSIALFCFSLWVAASSLVYVMKVEKSVTEENN